MIVISHKGSRSVPAEEGVQIIYYLASQKR